MVGLPFRHNDDERLVQEETMNISSAVVLNEDECPLVEDNPTVLFPDASKYILKSLLTGEGEWVYGLIPTIMEKAREEGAVFGQRVAEVFLAHKNCLPELANGTRICFLGYRHPDTYNSIFCLVKRDEGWQEEWKNSKTIWTGKDLFPARLFAVSD